MPICPRCNTTIHREAKAQCPACGYSLLQLDDVFGSHTVTFPRVLDHAGVLLQHERVALLNFLADLERKIPPVALCIYLTNHGQSQEFRSHAHWILNHARIHTPSFGKREGRRAIEDAELRERRPGEPTGDEMLEEPHESMPERCWHWLRNKVRDRFTPYPPPVRHEWMLVLVLDVQLKMACFSWGYMLDPYINPDKINSCITAARLQFRERATVAALELVMKKAATQLASSARRVNRTISKGGRVVSPLLAGALGLSLLGVAPTVQAAPTRANTKPAATASKPAAKPAAKPATKPAAKPTASKPAATAGKPAAKPTVSKPATTSSKPTTSKPAATAGKPAAKPETPKPAPAPAAPAPVEVPDDAVAEDVETPVETPAAPAGPASAPAPVDTGAAACYTTAPRWNRDDYRNLMDGRLGGAYNVLLPQGKVAETRAKAPANAGADESDTTVPGRYCSAYRAPSRAGLCDPQGLLSDVERADVEYVLREFNTTSPFRIYAAVFKAGQEIPRELNAATLATGIAQPCEYAALILYSIGESPDVQLGFQEITLTDEQQREHMLQVRDAATKAGGGVDGLLAAIRRLHAGILPMAADFRPIKQETQVDIPLINIELQNADKDKEKSFRTRFREWAKTPEALALFAKIGLVLAVLAPIAGWLLLRRRLVRLLDTTPDVRLSSPYGAGVSRYVRYLDGQEAAKEKNIFGN